jgi:hypothetical protein
MKVSLRTLDVVVKIVAEQLYVGDGAGGDGGVVEVAREENEGDVSDIVCLTKARHASDLQRWVSVGVENLGSVLNRWQPASINEFLSTHE